MDKRVMDKVYADKKAYVEQTLGEMLKPMYSFGSIKYARDAITNEEYVKITEANGYPWFICVTGDTEGIIGTEVCRMLGESRPMGLVRDKRKQIEVNKLFGGM